MSVGYKTKVKSVAIIYKNDKEIVYKDCELEINNFAMIIDDENGMHIERYEDIKVQVINF